jgi:AmmeMemoRadiSam system protein A
MYRTKSPHTGLALSVIVACAKKLSIESIKSDNVPKELQDKLSCFVSIHLTDGSLRGCIGTIEPRELNLYHEIIANAISASTRDGRFLPVKVNELENITISVDVLGKPYLIKDLNQLDSQNLGVIVSDGTYSRGVLLPNIEGVDTTEKQLNIAKRKAGLQNFDNKDLKIYAFTSTRYH